MSRAKIAIIIILIVSVTVSTFLIIDNNPDNRNDEPDPNTIFYDAYVSTFDATLQQELETFISDGNISQEEVDQINFLKQFSQADQINFIENGKFADFDWDNDNMNNYFEKVIAGLPYDVYNGRYGLLVDTHEDPHSADLMSKFLINEQRILPKNVINLSYTNATISNWKEAVTRVSSVADKNSLVYVMLESHGNVNGICFNDGYGKNNGYDTHVSYEEIGKNLDSIISSRTVVSLFCCGQEGALDSLDISSSPSIVVTIPADWFFATSKNYSNSYIQSLPAQYDPIETEAYDIDGNGYVSVGESFDTQMKSMERYFSELQTEEDYIRETQKHGMSDSNNIASEIFLGDFSVKNQDW